VRLSTLLSNEYNDETIVVPKNVDDDEESG
jgi:hypothetical protein